MIVLLQVPDTRLVAEDLKSIQDELNLFSTMVKNISTIKFTSCGVEAFQNQEILYQ